MHDDASMRPVLQLRLHRRHFAHHSTKLLGGAVGRTTPRTKQQLYCLFQSLDGDSLQGETHLRDHYLHRDARDKSLKADSMQALTSL